MPFLPVSSCCLEGFVLPGEPKGVIEPATATQTIARYHATPADGLPPANRAVVLAYDGLGFSSPNTRLLADNFANRLGVHVFVPDYLPNPPPVKLMEPLMESYPGEHADRSWFATAKAWLNIVWALPYIPGFFQFIAGPKIQKAVKEIQKDGYTSLAGVGYCLGGSQMLAFMGQGDSCPLSAAVVCHPGLNSLSDVKACKIPTSWVVAEVDTFFPPNRANEVEAILKEKGIPYEIRHYPGTVHGFGARPNLGVETVKKAFEDASDQTVDWLKKHFVNV